MYCPMYCIQENNCTTSRKQQLCISTIHISETVSSSNRNGLAVLTKIYKNYFC